MDRQVVPKDSSRMTREHPEIVNWNAIHYSNNPPVTTYSKPSPTYSKYERTNLESGRHPGKKKKMSDDHNFGSYGGSKKKASGSRYPWLGGKNRKMSW